MKSTRLQLLGPAFLFVACLVFSFYSPDARADVTARYIRIDNPTGFAFQWRQVQVFSGGQNIILHHPEMFTGTVPALKENTHPTPENIVLTNPREAAALVDGTTDAKQRASEWYQYIAPDNAHYMNPWIEIDLGKEYDIEKIVLYGSGYPATFYLDKGHRVVSALDANRKVVWAAKFQYYDKTTYPDGVFTFVPTEQTPAENPVAGTVIPEKAQDWVSMAWLLNAEAPVFPPDAEQRMKHFADRNSPVEVERLAKRFFAELDPKTPGLETAFQLYNAGQYQPALDAWKKYWFARMQVINTHQGLHGDFISYSENGDDLLKGIMVTITPGGASAIRYIPGEIKWIDLPPPGSPDMQKAIDECVRRSEVGIISWPLLYAYRKSPDPKYIQRWSEITDDWSLNFFPDAEKPPYEVENLFTFNPGQYWETLMEDLSDIAKEHPELIEQMPSTTLARIQLTCLEKYTTAYWRQVRGTVFNHTISGDYVYVATLNYVQEFFPGQRAQQEFQQGVNRFLTLGAERDGAITEIGDEGHMEYFTLLSTVVTCADAVKEAWVTPQWKNYFYNWYDLAYKYMFRHLSPGGYEHRFAVDYRPIRWTSTWKPYLIGRPTLAADRDATILGDPEVRRMLDAWGHISSPIPDPIASDPVFRPILGQEQQSHDQVQAFLGNEKPGPPHVNSDWMPYTGAYYFRGSWDDNAPFLAMMACGSHGGSQAPQWEYSMIYHYDYDYPLFAAKPIQVDGMQPQQLFGRMNCFQPGTKTMDLTNADEKPAEHRWLSDSRYDFGEAEFHGGYQNYPGFHGNWDDGSLRINDPGKGVPDMHSLRQIIQVRGAARLFIVTDAIESPDGASHRYSIPYKISLSTRLKDPTKPFSPDQLQIDPKGQLSSDNPDGPSVNVYQFADQPIKYNRDRDAKADGYYSHRLGGGIGIADQPVSADFNAAKMSMVSVISSRDKGAADRIASIEPLGENGAVGFHAKLKDGGEIWYEAAPLGNGTLTCGPATATAQGLLVQSGKDGVSGIVLGGKNLTLNGQTVAMQNPDFEFAAPPGGATQITNIYTPIDPISFLPNNNAFADSEMVQMVSKTPNIEIHYTTDCSLPTLASPLYTGPVKITETANFAAVAWRLGADGKPLPHEDFEVDGTKFSAPSYGWFTKRPYNPPVEVAASGLQPGLNYDYLNAPWWKLYAEAHWLPAAGGGTADREMDTSKVSTNDSYGMRYKGYIKVPQDGVYTFQAPHELSYMDNAPSYDLRLYIDGEEWYLTQGWQGHGTWSIPLKAGFHAFQLDFADARTKPWQRSGIWNFYPRPWSVYQDKPTDLLVSGPGLDHVRIPQDWFFRQPEPRTFPDERVLVDSANELNCTWDNAVDASLANVQKICFRTDGNPSQVFANLSFAKSDGTQMPYTDVVRNNGATGLGGGIFLNLQGEFTRVAGTLALGPKENVIILYHNPADEANPVTPIEPAFPRGGITTTAEPGRDPVVSR